jgi:hypothetical protein
LFGKTSKVTAPDSCGLVILAVQRVLQKAEKHLGLAALQRHIVQRKQLRSQVKQPLNDGSAATNFVQGSPVQQSQSDGLAYPSVLRHDNPLHQTQTWHREPLQHMPLRAKQPDNDQYTNLLVQMPPP